MRDILMDRLKRDLVGPHTEDEVLDARPSDVYLTGILWPRETRMGGEEDERLGSSGAEETEMNGGGEEESASLAGMIRPCSAGVSFAARGADAGAEMDVSVRFATYDPVTPADPDSRAEWHRRTHCIAVHGVALEDAPPFIELERRGAPPGIKLHVRTARWSGGSLATITLLNYAEPDEDEGREGIERLTLFQVRIEIRPRQGTVLVARPARRAVLDEDDRSAELLYRDAHEFATGHTCSVEWESGLEPKTVNMVATNWIPTATVPATSPVGHKVFDILRTNAKHRPLSVKWLATAGPDELADALQLVPTAYATWIEEREAEASSLPESFQVQARRNIAACREIRFRMAAGVTRIAGDATMSRAFRLANLAMDLQHGWNPEKARLGMLEWRPFQLGFILLAAASVADREHPEREVMDLLWFPTGGGKTEAYLALIAFLAFYRRLSAGDGPDADVGVAAIMRYTLRLLTTQQFSRAASVLLACEAIRRGRIHNAVASRHELGRTPFSIGLWVGGEAVPNKVKHAAAALSGAPDQPTPKQLVDCPSCRKPLVWQHDEQAGSIHVRCENEECLLFDPWVPLPVWTVDEDVYRKRPTLLIGTIDKFAQIVRRKEVNDLFSLSTGRPPDLILQDELHLISGPLGTVAGLYEAAIDRMFSSGGAHPKIIGSTATIRRASEQVTSLFHRKTVQFPPSCLDAEDSAFAVVDRSVPGRLYAGVTTAGRSAKFTLQAVAASLLQSAHGGITDEGERDPYWTLVSYFNSLRELGGALVLMQDDVNDSLALLAQRRNEMPRDPESIEELTSRRTQAEVREMLDRLATPVTKGALDVVLATNMLSVGVDIPRLGLMMVNGQPKGIAEYIQATSRVGRSGVPGLIVALLNNAKARDRSHYENFPTWHETLYRDVEPTSVTPFAPRARDRALHAVLVALVRHLVDGMLDKPMLDDDATDVAKDLIDDIVQRSTAIDPDEADDIKRELAICLDTWKSRVPQSYWSRQVSNSLLQDAERAAMLRAVGRPPGDAWPTLNSMRSVEASTRFRLAERLRNRPSERNGNGE